MLVNDCVCRHENKHNVFKYGSLGYGSPTHNLLHTFTPLLHIADLNLFNSLAPLSALYDSFTGVTQNQTSHFSYSRFLSFFSFSYSSFLLKYSHYAIDYALTAHHRGAAFSHPTDKSHIWCYCPYVQYSSWTCLSETVPPLKCLVHYIPKDIYPPFYVAELLCADAELIDLVSHMCEYNV